MNASLPMRLARSAVFTVVCVALGMGAHRFAGGAAPGVRTVLVALAAVWTVSAVLAGRERSPRAVMGLLVAGQVFLHQLLGASAEVAAPHAHLAGSVPPTHGVGVSAGMVLAHLTAALLTGWWLARGESAFWAVLHGAGAYVTRRVAALLALLRRYAAPPPDLPRPRERRDRRPVRHLFLQHAVDRRGPPVLHVF
ncbi:MFS transporter [Sphaerisporangium fuscum]|uniref:MFS transporter n=1 Tax=Sphaerisporangium fuscum TaxID=2835868 RepID=UPI001BDD97E7|nr:MFS transporter [Sphaerisporangium fuscum]